MKITNRISALLLALALGSLAPRLALAAGSFAGSAPAASDLTVQEREFLSVAMDLSRKCSEVIEKWLANDEVSEEKLLSALYYPIPNTDPPKFNTDWDRLSDRDIQALQEAALTRSTAIVYAVLTDRNGYVATHNTRYAQPLSGNPSVDFLNNRTKRFFVNRVVMASARNTAPFLIQKYERETGESIVDLSVPVTVRGKHFGCIRLGFRPAAQ